MSSVSGKLAADAEPPSNACPPYCYRCGRYTGYTGGMAGERKHYVAHPSVTYPDATTNVVRVCEHCFFRAPDDAEGLV